MTSKPKRSPEANAQRENPLSLILSLGFGESQFVVDNIYFQRILINSNCDKVDVETKNEVANCGYICMWICRLQFEMEDRKSVV